MNNPICEHRENPLFCTECEKTHKPNCSSRLQCLVYHGEGIPCPGYKVCDCGFGKLPTPLSEATGTVYTGEDMNKRFDKEFPPTPKTPKEGWEELKAKLPQAILGALEYRGFYDCGKYLDDTILVSVLPIISSLLARERATAQKEKEAMVKEMIEAVEMIIENAENTALLAEGTTSNNIKNNIIHPLSTLREIALKAGVKIK